MSKHVFEHPFETYKSSFCAATSSFDIFAQFKVSPNLSVTLDISPVSKLGCWLCVTSWRRVTVTCEPISGTRVGTLLARCNCALVVAMLQITVTALGWPGGFIMEVLSMVLAFSLVIVGVEALEAENFLRFFLSAAIAGPRPWANTWWASFVRWWRLSGVGLWWECSCDDAADVWRWWCCWWEREDDGGTSSEDLESEEPSEREPPSSDGEYIESSERERPGFKKIYERSFLWLNIRIIEIVCSNVCEGQNFGQ